MSPRWQPDPDVRRGRSVVSNLHAHLVFTTKYRRGALSQAMLRRCQEVMAAVCRDFGAELAEFNGEEDHVHLLVHYPPTVELARLVNSLKGVSSRRLRQEFPTEVRWTLLVAFVLRGLVRRSATGHHPRVHREPAPTEVTAPPIPLRLRPPSPGAVAVPWHIFWMAALITIR